MAANIHANRGCVASNVDENPVPNFLFQVTLPVPTGFQKYAKVKILNAMLTVTVGKRKKVNRLTVVRKMSYRAKRKVPQKAR